MARCFAAGGCGAACVLCDRYFGGLTLLPARTHAQAAELRSAGEFVEAGSRRGLRVVRELSPVFAARTIPEYEILFAVNDDGDPAVPLIQRLICGISRAANSVAVGAEHVGANRKVNKLIRAWRAKRSTRFWCSPTATCASVRVTCVKSSRRSRTRATGAVTSFYRGIAEKSLGAELEAIGASSDFFAGVLVAEWTEGMTFALGASIVTTKRWVAKIGGFEVDCRTCIPTTTSWAIASRSWRRVLLSREAVWTMYPAQTARGFLGASGSLGAHGAAVPAGFLFWIDLHAWACPGRCSLRWWRRRSGLPPRTCWRTSCCGYVDGVDRRRLGRGRRCAAPRNSGWCRCATPSISRSG